MNTLARDAGGMGVTAASSDRHFLAYLTANDRSHYQADFLNFFHMTRHHPGVPRVSMWIAVSRVRPFDATDHAAIAGLLRMAAKCPWLDVQGVLWKGNVGRDFSSAEACLRTIAEQASDDDYVLVRNRSACGPSQPGWYEQYVAQYERFPKTGLVGSTINFIGHPLRPVPGPTTHVQTYAYLSQWRHLAPLLGAYPGARCVDRLELINEGEIGLSRHMLERGLGLSCLYWPGELFTASRLSAPHLPQVDVKRQASTISLRYKYSQYLWQPTCLPSQLAWAVGLQAAIRLPRAGQTAIRQVVLDLYD